MSFPAVPVPLSGVAPEPTSAPAPTRTAGPPSARTVSPSGGSAAHGSSTLTSWTPPGPRRDLLTSAVIAGAVFLFLGVPLSSMVYQGVASVFDDGSGDVPPGGNWEAARMTPPEGPAPPSPGDPSEARIAALRPPAIPEDYQPSAPLTPGVLPGGPPPVPVPAPRRDSVDTDPAEAVIQSTGALRNDRVVVRLHSTPAGARVGVDGRSRGRTPAKLMLNPGRYALQITLGDVSTEVQLEATENQRLCFEVQGESLGTVDCATVL